MGPQQWRQGAVGCAYASLVLLNGPLVTTVKQHTVAQPLSTGVGKTRRSVSGNFVDAEVACLQLLRATRIV